MEIITYDGYRKQLKKTFEAFIQTLEIEKSVVYTLDEREVYGAESITLVIKFKVKGNNYGFSYIFSDIYSHLDREVWYVLERFKETYLDFSKRPAHPEWFHILD